MKKAIVYFLIISLFMQLFTVSIHSAEESATFIAETGETKIDFKNYTFGYRTSTGGNVMETGSGGSICIRKNDYVLYDVNVETAGYYKLTIATTYPGASPAKPISVYSGDTVLGKCNLSHTVSWSAPEETVGDEIYLEAGFQTLKFVTTTDAYFYYFILEKNVVIIHDIAPQEETKFEFEEYTKGYDKEGTDTSVLETYSNEALSGGTAVYLTNTGDTATFKLNIEKTAIYKIKIATSCTETPLGADVLIKKASETIASADLADTGDETVTSVLDFGEIFFENGIVDLTIETLTDAYFDYIIVEYVREIIIIEAENYTNDKNATVYENAFLSFNEGNWTEYEITVEKDGFYSVVAYSGIAPSYGRDYSDMKVYLDRKLLLEGRVNKTSGWRDFQPFNMGSVYLEAGDHIIKFEVYYGANYFDRFVVDYEGNSLELKNVYANGVKITEVGKAFRGTDYLELEFSQKLDKKDISSEKIYITDGENKIAADLVQDGKKVGLILKETLDYSQEYTIYINDVKDASGKLSVNDESFVFSTYDSGNDDGNATVNEINAAIKYEDITVVGKMYSSKSSLISGRKAEVYLGDEQTALGSAVTDKDGSFSVSVKLPDETQEGNIDIYVGGEYVSEKIKCSLIYVSKNTEKAIIEELKNTEGADAIGVTFEKYEKELGIDVSEDVKGLNDSSEVFKAISETDITLYSAEEIINLYYTYIAVETVNQAESTNEIETVISDLEKCKKLNINSDKINDLSQENRASVVEDILNLPAIKDAERLIASVNKIIDSALAAQNGKKGKFLSGDEKIDAYSGQGIDLPISFTEKFSEMKRIVFEIEGGNDEILDGAEVIKKTYGDIETEVKENTITVIYTPKSSDFTVSDIAILRVTLGEEEGNRAISISGYIEYDKELSYLIKEPINEKNIEISVTKNSDKPSRDDSYVSGGTTSGSRPSGGGNGGSVITPPSSEDNNEIKETLPFNDLVEVKWAEESIVNLVKLNIISKSEDGKFNPQNNTTREEIVKMIVETFGIYNENSEADFTDVSSDASFYKYVASAKDAGLVTGNDKGEFMSGNYLTREDAATMIWRALKQKGYLADNEFESFADDEAISDYAKEAVYQMRSLGIINGMGDNNFSPKSFVTRAQTAKIIYETVRKVTK